MSNILQQENPKLMTLLSGVRGDVLRQIALQIAHKAIVQTSVESQSPLITRALGVTEPDKDLQAELRALAHTIEEPYLQALDRGESTDNNPLAAQAFEQARAVLALASAISNDVDAEIWHVTYEALHAGVKSEDIEEIIIATQ